VLHLPVVSFCLVLAGVAGAHAKDGVPLPEKRSVPQARDAPDKMAAPPEWSLEEIAMARRACIAVLARATFALEPADPIREGVCGTPAPVALQGLPGDDGGLRIEPAATVTCAVAARLREWADKVLQPAASARLDSRIVAIRMVGSYTCRRRYNEPDRRLSQHALANAVDIGAFRTADGQTISVLEHWSGDDARGAFLRDVHAGACEIFDTVLGPRANAAHADHFHFDIGSGGVCE